MDTNFKSSTLLQFLLESSVALTIFPYNLVSSLTKQCFIGTQFNLLAIFYRHMVDFYRQEIIQVIIVNDKVINSMKQ